MPCYSRQCQWKYRNDGTDASKRYPVSQLFGCVREGRILDFVWNTWEPKWTSIYFVALHLVPPGTEYVPPVCLRFYATKIANATFFEISIPWLALECVRLLGPRESWMAELAPFIYHDGTNKPPQLLRTQPEQNYLESGVRRVSFTLMVIALFVIIASIIWVFIHRNHECCDCSSATFPVCQSERASTV